MLFGKKAVEEPRMATKQEYEEDDVELPEEEEDEDLYKKIDTKKPVIKEEKATPEPVKAEKEALIVSGAVIQDGLFEFVVRSNYPIGEIGSRV